jgi:hypothetical protein
MDGNLSVTKEEWWLFNNDGVAPLIIHAHEGEDTRITETTFYTKFQVWFGDPDDG